MRLFIPTATRIRCPPTATAITMKARPRPSSSDRLRERLRELERKLEPEGDKREGMSDAELEKRSSTLGKAFKVSTELVAGVFVGGFVGWALDNLLMPKLGFNSTPLFLIVFLFLGIAAGFLNVFRAAREMGEK